jgi:hypothetical protein
MSRGSELFIKQQRFAMNFANLINYAIEQGYQITFPPEHENHIKKSLHYIGLARDINLFRNNIYLTKTSDYEKLGIYWESMGGTWGGRFKNRDGCHFSIEYKGVK